MAKKTAKVYDGMSKTQAILEECVQHPDKGPSEIAERLKAHGIKVTPAYVSTIKCKDKRRGTKKAPAPRKQVDIAEILETMRDFVVACDGDFDLARNVIEVARDLRE